MKIEKLLTKGLYSGALLTVVFWVVGYVMGLINITPIITVAPIDTGNWLGVLLSVLGTGILWQLLLPYVKKYVV